MGSLSLKKLYLDVCSLCRPFDEQSVARIRLETAALYLVFEYIRKMRYEMIVSPVHYMEIAAISYLQERVEVMEFINTFGTFPSWNLKAVKKRADELYQMKLGPADAAHVAFAEAEADVFVTCDDRLLRKCMKHLIRVPAMNPVEFSIKEELQ